MTYTEAIHELYGKLDLFSVIIGVTLGLILAYTLSMLYSALWWTYRKLFVKPPPKYITESQARDIAAGVYQSFINNQNTQSK